MNHLKQIARFCWIVGKGNEQFSTHHFYVLVMVQIQRFILSARYIYWHRWPFLCVCVFRGLSGH